MICKISIYTRLLHDMFGFGGKLLETTGKPWRTKNHLLLEKQGIRFIHSLEFLALHTVR